MKHFYYFAATVILWLSAIMAWADGVMVADTYTSPSDIVEGYYLVKARFKGSEYYVYHNSSDSRPFRIKAEASVDKSTLDANKQYVWYITKNANGQLIIQNASTGAFWPADKERNKNFQTSSTLANAALFQPETSSSVALDGGIILKQCQYKNGNNGLYIHANTPGGDPNLSYWDGNNVSDQASTVQFAFYKVEGLESSDVVTPAYGAHVVYKKEDETIMDTWIVGLKNTVVQPSILCSYYYSITPKESERTLGADKGEITISYAKSTSGLSFSFSTVDAPTWYKLQLRSNEGNYVVWNDDNNIKTGGNSNHISTYGTAAQTSYNALNGAYWAIVESGLGVKLYNRAAKKYVTVANKDAKATMTDQGTTFYMQTSSASGADFSLQYENTWGYLGDHQNNYLGTWSHNNASGAQDDAGSGYKVIAVDASDVNLAKTYVTSLSNTTNSEGLVLANTEYSKATSATSLDDLDKVDMSMNFDFTGYYRVRNVNADINRYLSSENIVVSTTGSLSEYYIAHKDMDRKITRTTDNDNFGSQLWQIVSNGAGTYSLINANTERSVGENSTSAIEMPINIGANTGEGVYTIVPCKENTTFAGYDATTMFVISSSNTLVGALTGDGNYIGNNQGSYTDKSNFWQLVKVTSVPVTIKSVGWASIAFPFAVQVPAESGVKAYIAESADDTRMTLSEIADGIIPAKTGVLLAKDGGGKVDLKLVTTTTTYPDNKLTYATAERNGYASKANYLLSAKTGTVGFLPSTMQLVPANKAFLPAANITSTVTGEAQMLNFYIGGTVTGVNVATDDAYHDTSAYYDLNGRRVFYPAHGIYVTGNGKKVFIK